MTNDVAKTRKSSTAIIRDVGFIVAVLGVVIAVIAMLSSSSEWFQFALVVFAIGALTGLVAAILWAAGLRR